MSDVSTHLGLPYLAAAQAQKHVTHNEALRTLDSLVQIAVIDTTVTDPPASPAEGDRYIVAAGATGVWSGRDEDVAAYVDGAWAFFAPEAGWLAFDVAGQSTLVFDGTAWQAIGGFLGTLTQLGINATADATNRLAVRSNAVLFNGLEAAEGGTGDIRFVVNKEADADTASLLFQSASSGRAEVGLAGDTDFVFKVSANGADWVESIRIDKDTGLPAILYDNATSGLVASTAQGAIDEIAASGGSGAVDSVFGRTGTVTAAASDYDASQIDNDSGVGGATVAAALDILDGGKHASLGFTPRERLAADRTYYVRTDGSDSNDGLTDNAGGAFLTLQKAWSTVAALDTSIYTVTIRIADGTYAGGLSVTPAPVGGEVLIEGNTTTPGNVVLQPGSGVIIAVAAACGIRIRGMQLGGGGESNGIRVTHAAAKVRFDTIAFATVSASHMEVDYGVIEASGNWSIVGNATRHIYSLYTGKFIAVAVTVTLTGTPAFTRFVECSNPGLVSLFAMTWSGSATGQRYNISLNGVVNTFGGATLPGSTAGAAVTGGQYA